MRRRPGFHLVETIVVMAILPVVMVVTTQLFRVFALDMPRNHRMVEEHTTVLHLLEQLRADVQSSQDFDVTPEADRPVLTIRRQDGDIIYRTQAGRVARTGPGAEANTIQWRLPKARVLWSRIEPHPGDFALQVTSGLHVERGGRSTVRLANTHLFFASRDVKTEDGP
jgi:hypothetical protein